MAESDRIVLPGDATVPNDLRAIWPAEVPALYVRGTFPTHRPAIAIVGTTDPVPEARSWAFAFAQEAARLGWAVVSGLARGIDSAAHEGALVAGGTTIGVAANGLDTFSRGGRESIVGRIVDSGGTVVSIAPPGGSPTRERLLLRNQFTSGFADIVLAVQSRGRAGTLATLRHACRQGRVIATLHPPPGGNSNDWAGNSLLLASESPWPDRNLRWQSAFSVKAPADLAELFAHFRDASPVDAPPAFNETRKPVQPRLLEQRAIYDGDD